MAVHRREVGPPRGARRLLLRAPIWLYRAGLGALLGQRMLLLTHTGRRTGTARQTVLEVVDRGPEGYLVASGFGERAQWLRNIERHPEVTIQVGRRRLPAGARRLPADDSARAMLRYAQRHPRLARRLMSFCGIEMDGTPDDYLTVGRELVPFVRITPREG